MTEAEAGREITANQSFLLRLEFCLKRLSIHPQQIVQGRRIALLARGCAVMMIGADADTFFDTQL